MSGALVNLRLSVNGRARRVRVPPMKRLLDVLREDCGLTGTKEGCGEGECGACTVLLDGRPVNACLVPAVHADGARVVTVEGLAHGPALSVLQRTLVERGGVQCGMCTPGILVTAHALLARAPGRVPGADEVREALAGNLCRCTGYQSIVDAVRAAARATPATPRGRGAARGPKVATKRPATKRAAARRAATKSGPAKRPATRRTAARRPAKQAATPRPTKQAAAPRPTKQAAAPRPTKQAATRRPAKRTAARRPAKRGAR
jgi:aerobic carbon-monoxide dehydrogenase small subunit